MKTPTFSLPACPICSNIIHVTRPFWKFASNTSEKRGRPTYILVGCEHAVPTGPMEKMQKLRDDPNEWALVEENWEREAAAMLEAKTAGWSALARDRFIRELQSKTDLPGATGEMVLEPLDQQKADAETKNAGDWLE